MFLIKRLIFFALLKKAYKSTSFCDFKSQILFKKSKISILLDFPQNTKKDDILKIETVFNTICSISFFDQKDFTILSTQEKTITKQSEVPKEQKIAKKVIAIISSKGGVGKSTLCFEVAKNYAKQGKKVGILDLDIYGPTQNEFISQAIKIDKSIDPVKNQDGIFISSIGFILNKEDALIWRGPMLAKMINTMLFQVKWPQDMDIILIDTPPGTGDIHISAFSKFEIDGTIIVSTFSKLAIAQLYRTVSLVQNLKSEILGIFANDITNEQSSNKELLLNMAKDLNLQILSIQNQIKENENHFSCNLNII